MSKPLQINDELLANPRYTRWVEDPVFGSYAEVGHTEHDTGFIAVVPENKNLPHAKQFQDHLLTRAPYQSAIVYRQSKTLEQSVFRLGQLFYNYTFGYEITKPNPDDKSRAARQERIQRRRERGALGSLIRGSARSGNVIIKPHGLYYSTLSTAADPRKKRDYKNFTRLFGRLSFGADLHALFQACAHPDDCNDYIAWTLTNGMKTSDPGVLHFDSAQPCEKYNPYNIAPSLLKKINQSQPTQLSGNVTRTISLSGGGTIMVRTTAEMVEDYQRLEAIRKITGDKAGTTENINDITHIAFQACDGDLTAMRSMGWPDDPQTGDPRLPSYHCAPFFNAYGHPNSANGRITAIQSARVTYMHPVEYDRLTNQ